MAVAVFHLSRAVWVAFFLGIAAGAAVLTAPRLVATVALPVENTHLPPAELEYWRQAFDEMERRAALTP